MTSVADLVNETKTHFLGGLREQKNKLTTAVDADDTTFTFTYDLGGIKPGAVLSLGLERVHVWSTGTNTAVVERGWDGSTAATHATTDIVSVNARVDDFAILRAINNELNSLSSPSNGLFRARSIDLTFNPSTYGYDLASSGTVIGQPLRVLAEQTGVGEWIDVPPSQWVYNASADTTDFPSGRSLEILGGYGSSGLKVRVFYRAPFVAVSTLAQDVQAVSFLPSSANDIPPMGAALQLASGRPLARSDLHSQGSTRRAEEVTTQDTLLAPRGLEDRYRKRIDEEAARLAADFPQVI